MAARQQRLAWVDYAKGLSILLVVHMHATYGVEAALGREGIMGMIAHFASTFRMPMFFMVSGLFLARSMSLPWRDYIDRKVLHLVYFFLVWTAITLALKGLPMVDWQWQALPGFALHTLIEPFGTLWFIYVLALFYLATRAMRFMPRPVLWGLSGALHVLAIQTGWTVIDAFADNYVFFLTGYVLAQEIMAGVRVYQRKPQIVIPVFLLAMAANASLFQLGLVGFPGITLAAGLVLPYAVMLLAGMLAVHWPQPWLAHCGRYSIVIYLSFFIPMVVAREALIRLGLTPDVDLVSLLVWLCAAVSPLLVFHLVRGTWLGLVYQRPSWLHLGPRHAITPAE